MAVLDEFYKAVGLDPDEVKAKVRAQALLEAKQTRFQMRNERIKTIMATLVTIVVSLAILVLAVVGTIVVVRKVL